MAKGNKVNKLTEGLDEMFASGVPIEGFLDGITRYATPVTLKEFKKFMDNVQMINAEALWTNFLTDDGYETIATVLEMTFKSNDIDEIIEVLNANNFTDIFNKILEINGIVLKGDNNSSEEGK